MCLLLLAIAAGQDVHDGQQSSSEAPPADASLSGDGAFGGDGAMNEPSTSAEHWEAHKRRLAEGQTKPVDQRPRDTTTKRFGHNKRKKKKSWLSALGVGGEGPDGKPKKLPKLSLEEVLTGVIVIAFLGFFFSFSI